MPAERFLNNFLEKLKAIDWTKNTIYMLIYFVLIFAFFGFFLYPSLQDTKSRNIDYRKAELAYDAVTKEYADKETALAQYEKGNKGYLSGFTKNFTVEEITKILSTHIKDPEVKRLQQGSRAYPSETFSVKGRIGSPAEFYALSQELEKSGYIVSINFPIDFRRLDTHIEIGFEIEIFKTSAP